MTAGTKISLAVFAAFIGILILYYGVLMPSGDVTRSAGDTMGVGVGAGAVPKGQSEPIEWQGAAPLQAAATPTVGGDAGAPLLASSSSFLSKSVDEMAGDDDEPFEGAWRASDAIDPLISFPLLNVSPARPEGAGSVATGSRESSAAHGGIGGARVRAPSDNSPAATAAAPTQPTVVEYTVQEGDTMSSIAGEWFGDQNKWSLVARANPWVDPNRMQIGQVLKLPAKETKPELVREQLKKETATRDKSVYVVQSGDTLAKIARDLYGSERRWKEIFEANRAVIGDDPGMLSVGMKLTLPRSGTRSR
ncbi:MAG: LysM peptidoglycan-binding domain-containing protein [Phycisphaerales bacterium]|nr:LysM peptidoglycan-binding domain-containing protein [Phycisphaerales bacterium]MCI0630299.1 LysM peptidoglycan-binding domain-containing protein [Phycisphaerales bacterium]MCI0677289.1 LysM peptidoglycan-binding domain-containing protein [Phycisphaerales bacterium]